MAANLAAIDTLGEDLEDAGAVERVQEQVVGQLVEREFEKLASSNMTLAEFCRKYAGAEEEEGEGGSEVGEGVERDGSHEQQQDPQEQEADVICVSSSGDDDGVETGSEARMTRSGESAGALGSTGTRRRVRGGRAVASAATVETVGHSAKRPAPDSVSEEEHRVKTAKIQSVCSDGGGGGSSSGLSSSVAVSDKWKVDNAEEGGDDDEEEDDEDTSGLLDATASERERQEAALQLGVATLGLRPPKGAGGAETERFLRALMEKGGGSGAGSGRKGRP